MLKNLPAMQKTQVQSPDWKIPWRREWLPTPVFLPREFQGQRSLVGSSPWDHKVLDMKEQLSTYHQDQNRDDQGEAYPGKLTLLERKPGAFLVAQRMKHLPAMQETQV